MMYIAKNIVYLFILVLSLVIFLTYNSFFLIVWKETEVLSILNLVSIFFIFNLLIVAFGTNPIINLLNLICGFVLITTTLICNKALFIPLVLLIVYVGAIAMLFLFVIMLCNLNLDDFHQRQSLQIFYVFFLINCWRYSLYYQRIVSEIINAKICTDASYYLSNQYLEITKIGNNLYCDDAWPTILITFVLLGTLFSAILLCYDKNTHDADV